MASNPFKFVNAINSGTFVPLDGEYSKFMTGRAFSYHLDTVIIANEINLYPQIDDQLHYDFMKSLIRPKKRFAKWAKPPTHAKASTLSAYYQIPMSQAYLYQDLFSDQEIEEIAQIVQQKEKTK